jgi:pimeloyl-ACP methyl ester carboxylesterase
MAERSRKRRAHFPSFEAAFEHFEGRGLFRDFRPEALALYVSEGLEETPGDSGASGAQGVRLKCDPAVEAAIFEAGPTIDPFTMAAGIDAPTRILHAQGGNFSRAVYDAFAARMPRAEVKTCAGGHLFPMEEPEKVWTELRA